MRKLLLTAAAIIGFVSQQSLATSELNLNDRSAMMQLADDLLRCVITFNFMALKMSEGPERMEMHGNARDYSIAILHLYKQLKVLDDQALARRRWNAMFDHVKWADQHDALDVEMKICNNIEPLQRKLIRHWELKERTQ